MSGLREWSNADLVGHLENLDANWKIQENRDIMRFAILTELTRRILDKDSAPA